MFKNIYKTSAIITVSLFIFFVFLNIFLGAVFFIKDHIKNVHAYTNSKQLFTEDGKPVQNGKRNAYQLDFFDFNACKEIGEQYASDVLDDFYELDSKGLSASPRTKFYFSNFHGEKVNIVLSEKGFPHRKTINPERSNNKPIIRIYTLGNSTTSGFFVSDEHTWPSFLSRILNDRAKRAGKPYSIEVTNFGRAGDYPGQEALLVFDLLRNGFRPNLLIFLDGYNTQSYEDYVPTFTSKIADEFLSCYYYGNCNLKLLLPQILKKLPVNRLTLLVKNKFLNKSIEPVSISSGNSTLEEDVKRVLNHYEQNRKLIKAVCSAYGAETLFFLQPHPLYKYNLGLFRDNLKEQFSSDKEEIAFVGSYYEALRKNSKYIDFSNLYPEWGINKKVYIDDYHYSPAFNKFLAEKIAKHIDLDKLDLVPEIFDESKTYHTVRFKEINNLL